MLNHVGAQRIETNRLILRKHKITDADDLFNNYATDPAVSRFFVWEPHKNVDESKTLLQKWVQEYAKPDDYHWLIELKDISQVIGYIDFADMDDTNDSLSVLYALSHKYWNQGIATEACTAVINFAFSVLHAKRISAHHHVDNPGSGRVMQKCGMRYLKTAYKHLSDCEEISGDYCYYEIAADDWKRHC